MPRSRCRSWRSAGTRTGSAPPARLGATGQARALTAGDAETFVDWCIAFAREATPHDPEPRREELLKKMHDGQHLLWIDGDRPVSLASIVRRTANSATIGRVYTPPDLRGRGYAGSVVAAMAERVFADGKTAVCLYVDLRNPASRRCYAKVGFAPVCRAWHVPRVTDDAAS